MLHGCLGPSRICTLVHSLVGTVSFHLFKEIAGVGVGVYGAGWRFFGGADGLVFALEDLGYSLFDDASLVADA